MPVTESGAPLSVAETCGLCHELEDADFVAVHGYHSSVQDDLLPPERRLLMVNGPRIPSDGDSQMNCFLCHLQQPDHAGRQAAIDAGTPEWSISATLLGTGLLAATADGYQWNSELIGEDGEAEIDLQPVSEAQCGACHGMVHDGTDPLLVPLGTGQHWTTETTGQVFSPQPVRLSGMNHANKDALDLVWDVHAERLVSCGDCHYSQRAARRAWPARRPRRTWSRPRASGAAARAATAWKIPIPGCRNRHATSTRSPASPATYRDWKWVPGKASTAPSCSRTARR